MHTFTTKSQAQYSWVGNPNVLMCSIAPCKVIINIIYLPNVEMVIISLYLNLIMSIMCQFL